VESIRVCVGVSVLFSNDESKRKFKKMKLWTTVCGLLLSNSFAFISGRRGNDIGNRYFYVQFTSGHTDDSVKILEDHGFKKHSQVREFIKWVFCESNIHLRSFISLLFLVL